MSQPVLPEMFGRSQPKAHKAVRQTSRAVYRVRRARDIARADAGQETGQGQVLRCLAAYWNLRQESPSAKELLAWMIARGEAVSEINDVRPRLTELVDQGLVESAGTRTCRESGKTVHVWRVRQR